MSERPLGVVFSCAEYDTVCRNVHLGLCPAVLSTTLCVRTSTWGSPVLDEMTLADAELEVHSAENPGLSKVPFGLDKNIAFMCFAYCRQLCRSNFCLPDSFSFGKFTAGWRGCKYAENPFLMHSTSLSRSNLTHLLSTKMSRSV